MSLVRLVRFLAWMSLTHAEQLFSTVLEQAANRSASGWLTAFKLRRGRFASESELCTIRGEQLPPRPTALEWCASASKAVHTSSGCTLERLRPLRPRAASRAGYAACICFYETPEINCNAVFRRRTFVLLGCRPCPSEPYEQALWARKARAKDSCKNFIPKSIFEILLHKILKF